MFVNQYKTYYFIYVCAAVQTAGIGEKASPISRNTTILRILLLTRQS